MQLVCGVDSSTQSTTVQLRSLDDGAVVASGRASHAPTAPPVSEQDPEGWWRALIEAMHQVREHLASVTAISVAAQQHGLVLLDESGAAVRPAKLWNDTTSAPQAADLVRRLGAETWARACGSVPVASFTVAKLAWLAQHEPANLGRTDRIMLPHDYLTWRLTGAHVTDQGDASGTGWWSPSTQEYDGDLLAAAVGGARPWLKRLPRVLGPRDGAGRITPAASGELGLSRRVIVGAGSGDNMASALGLGLAAGDVAVSLGTSGTVFAVSDTATADASGAVAGFADATGKFLPLVCTLNATKVTDTVARWLGVDLDELSTLALEPHEHTDLPVLIPYLDGERTPDLPRASGLLTGLRTTTTRADLAYAAHVGVLCGLLDGAEALERVGVELSGRRLLTGGGARSPAYQQLAADLWEAPVEIPDVVETVATGACVQAAAVVGQEAPEAVVERWGLRTGTAILPKGNRSGTAVRAAYRAAAQAATELSSRT